ncbi:hypothetical protein J7481_26420, partial [Labrenzia sp. R4_2]|nr:hypothetical protein [Labrenzia sp. R4_2]
PPISGPSQRPFRPGTFSAFRNTLEPLDWRPLMSDAELAADAAAREAARAMQLENPRNERANMVVSKKPLRWG